MRTPTTRPVIVTLTQPQAEVIVAALNHYAQWCSDGRVARLCDRATTAVEAGTPVAAGDGTGRCLTCGGPCPLNDAYCEEHLD